MRVFSLTLFRFSFVCLFVFGVFSNSGAAQENTFRLAVPQSLVATGFMKHLLPRFSLKTGVRIELVDPSQDAEAAFSIGPEGRAVFAGPENIWHFWHGETVATERFSDWLSSDIGRKTILSFAPGGAPMFTTELKKKTVTIRASFDGDAIKGEALALQHCGRCHVVGEMNRMNGLGSTPSFGVLRTLPNWDDRFQAFFTLNPHPAFTQIEDVTEPFDPERPSPIVPVEMTLEELESILAFVELVEPADLGGPVQSR